MKKIFLTALLGLSPALAQGAPANTWVMKLSAPVGTSVEMVSVTTTTAELEDLQVREPGGKVTKMSPAELAQAKAEMSKELNKNASVTGKVFYKVLDRYSDGTVKLLQTSPSKMGMIRMTYSISPNGKSKVLGMQSENAQMQNILSSFGPDMFSGAFTGDTNITGLYGQPMTVGQPVASTQTLDIQKMMNDMLGGLAKNASSQAKNKNESAEIQKMMQGLNIKATPLVITTKSTLLGTSAQGQPLFQSDSSAKNWKMEMGDSALKKIPMFMRLELLDMNSTSQLLYRTDGLPAAQSTKMSQRMKMTMVMKTGEQMIMQMKMNVNTELRQK